MASILTPFASRDLLNRRIPDRMKEVYLCAKFAEFVKKRGYEHEANLQFAEIGGYQLASTKLIGYAILDSGLIMCRALFDLLGIYYSQRHDDLRERTIRKAEDVCLSYFQQRSGHLSRITLDQAFHNPRYTSVRMQTILLRTLRRTNKAIGHVTTVRGRDMPFNDIIITCTQVILLLNLHLYQALGRSPVDFDNGVTWYDL
jgi:hypothetical protein